jgi:hypothetical protein
MRIVTDEQRERAIQALKNIIKGAGRRIWYVKRGDTSTGHTYIDRAVEKVIGRRVRSDVLE